MRDPGGSSGGRISTLGHLEIWDPLDVYPTVQIAADAATEARIRADRRA
jgi:hypothetical protein